MTKKDVIFFGKIGVTTLLPPRVTPTRVTPQQLAVAPNWQRPGSLQSAKQRLRQKSASAT